MTRWEKFAGNITPCLGLRRNVRLLMCWIDLKTKLCWFKWKIILNGVLFYLSIILPWQQISHMNYILNLLHTTVYKYVGVLCGDMNCWRDKFIVLQLHFFLVLPPFSKSGEHFPKHFSLALKYIMYVNFVR